MRLTGLPNFPESIQLDGSHQAVISDVVKSFEPYSDYNFISLWSWDHEEKLKLSLLNGNLVVRFQDYLDSSKFFYSFLGQNQVDATAKELLEFSQREAIPQLKLIPEFVISKFKQPSDFKITEDIDSFDYIVAVEDMLEPHGQTDKRYLNKFIREQASSSVKELDIKDEETTTSMLVLLEDWQAQAEKTKSVNPSEHGAIHKLLRQPHQINTDRLHIVGIYLDDRLRAFSVNEVLEEGFAMGHFKKTDRSIKGLSVALDHYTAKSLAKKGISKINHEQDLGVSGLREAKQGHERVYFLKKYTIGLS